MAVEKLHKKQDRIQNVSNFHDTKCQGQSLIPRSCNMVDLKLTWVPGHSDCPPNKKANINAKKAAKGDSRPGNHATQVTEQTPSS